LNKYGNCLRAYIDAMRVYVRKIVARNHQTTYTNNEKW